MELDKTSYRFPFLIFQVDRDELESSGTKPTELETVPINANIVKYGEIALSLIKKERSDERDNDRNTLLIGLCKAAIELKDFKKARMFGRELILDFGQSVNVSGFDDSTHIGNITMGFAELNDGNTEKAKEHLLIAIRAPLRQKSNYLIDLDMSLAKALLSKNENKAVLEYLDLCLTLAHFVEEPEIYSDEIAAIKSWRTQISEGKTPSLEFAKP